MERVTEQRKKVLYRKIGRGSFRTKARKIVKPNETFLAFPEDIPEAFKDTVRPVNPEDVAEEQKVLKDVMEATAEGKFSIRRRGASRWFDLVENATEKPLNEKALTEADANNLLKVMLA
jgi:hypothetical protein